MAARACRHHGPGQRAHVEERLAPAQLGSDEAHAGAHADHARGDHAGAAPAGVGALDQREHDAAERQDREHDPDQVDRRSAGPRRLGQHRPARRHDQDRDGHVHQEHRLPADLLHEHAAQHRPQHQPYARDRRPHAERLRALLGREHDRDQRQRRRQHARGRRAHQRPRADQRAREGSDRAQARGDAEARHAGEEHALAAEAVGQPAAEEQQPGERDQEGVEHPLELADSRVEVLRDVRQRDVDDRHVDRADEHRSAHDQQALLPLRVRRVALERQVMEVVRELDQRTVTSVLGGSALGHGDYLPICPSRQLPEPAVLHGMRHSGMVQPCPPSPNRRHRLS